MEAKAIEMAALGRSLYPGMLYDCRSDTFIPGVTLWDNDSLSNNLDSRKQPNTDLKFSASDSISDKASLLDVSASLKASFLGGLVEVGGSAKYLNDQKSSRKQSRVTMQYSQRTKFEQLTMTQLGSFTYPQVFEQKTATHVVTSVLYGSQVFMVFDRTTSDNENLQEVEGNLKVMVKNIRAFSLDGEGALQMNEKEKELAESIRCTFYGDCVLDDNPTTYTEALQLFKKLPSLLREKENDAVPVRVWLYPLTLLDRRAAKLENEISGTMITKVQSLLEYLGNVKTRVNDFLETKIIEDFETLKHRLQKFQDSLEQYKLSFQKALGEVLPAIRGGAKQIKVLGEILLIHERSPFSPSQVEKWLDSVQGEIDALKSYTGVLSGVELSTSSVQFNKNVFDPLVDTVVCLSFTSLNNEDTYLSTLTEFLNVDEFENLPAISGSSDQGIQAWFKDPEISEKMRRKLDLFKSFFEANKENMKTRFVIAAVQDASSPGTSIRLYRKGKMLDSQFEPVSKPTKPSVDNQTRNVIVKLQKSPTGVTKRFRVEYRGIQPGDSEADGEKWQFIDTPDSQETFTLTGLQLGNQYQVRYRAVSDEGMSEASDSSDTFCLQESETGASFCIELKNKILTSLATSQWSLGTIQSELSNRASNIDIPYEGTISEGLKPGRALFLQGDVHKDGEDFALNLKTGSGIDDDIAFQYKFHFETYKVVCNSFKDKQWGTPVETTNAPLTKGKSFKILMVIHPECYEVIVNGQVFSRFYHRIPLKEVSVLKFTGGVDMKMFCIVEVENVVMKITNPSQNVIT